MFENDKISSGDYIYADKYNNFISDVAAEFQNTSSITSADRELLDRLERGISNYNDRQNAIKAFGSISDGATGKINGFDYIIKVLNKDDSGNTTKILFQTSEQGQWVNASFMDNVNLQDITILKKLRAFPALFSSFIGYDKSYFDYWLPSTSSEMPITGYWYWSNCYGDSGIADRWAQVIPSSWLFDTALNKELTMNYLISRKGDGGWDDYQTRPYRSWITYAYIVRVSPTVMIPLYKFFI